MDCKGCLKGIIVKKFKRLQCFKAEGSSSPASFAIVCGCRKEGVVDIYCLVNETGGKSLPTEITEHTTLSPWEQKQGCHLMETMQWCDCVGRDPVKRNCIHSWCSSVMGHIFVKQKYGSSWRKICNFPDGGTRSIATAGRCENWFFK